ncbi:MAG: hypothetical protein M3O20_03760 [Acidobacteriota bacterium]|nr:hypothetical protein [Acidobacteriota bacterium]
MNGFIEWCQYNALAQFMRSAKWPYPAVEVLHIAGLILVFGSMLILNLRIFGRILRQEPVPQVAAGLSTITFTGIAAQFISGPPLFMASAMKFAESTPFKLKLLFLAVALTYHFGAHRPFALDPHTPARTLRLSAAASMLSWIGVIFAGFAIELLAG